MFSFFTQDWIFEITIGIIVFTISLFWSGRIISWLSRKSLGQRETVIELLDRMFVEINERQVTYFMLSLSFGLGSLVFLAFWPNLVPGVLFASVVTIVGWSTPKFLIQGIYNRRCDRLVDQMVDGMTIMANGVKSGLSVPQCMERVVENLPNPISQEFGLVLSQIRIGRSVEEALIELAERIPRPDVQMFVTSVNILKETGGNLAETFVTITTTIRERQKVQKKIESLTAQGLMQGLIITLVPFGLLVVFLLIDPNFVMPLFTKPLGWFFLFVMLGLQVVGGLVIRKIVKIDV